MSIFLNSARLPGFSILFSIFAACACSAGTAGEEVPVPHWDWVPEAQNRPIGTARGINPGRVIWVRDPLATRWTGRWNLKEDQWWTDANTDGVRVSAMVSEVIQKLGNTTDEEAAWKAVFSHHNKRVRALEGRGYQSGEGVAIKVNLNNSSSAKTDNYSDASPQLVLAVVRQLVEKAHVPEADILIYDVRRSIFSGLISEVWAAYPAVRFVQGEPATSDQPRNPRSGDQKGIEAAVWVDALTYSAGDYKEARLIAQQVKDAGYLVNLAMLKAHSYPHNYMEDGDAGQTGMTMIGKNHFGSMKGTWELHAAINTLQKGTAHAYSPMVDLAASPALGEKTVLFLLDALYSGRKWRTYPLHFPNPPFNNRVEPYENGDWPASVLGSLDGVALDSVGIDIYHSQTKNNRDAAHGNVSRMLIRENADDYMHEMALADNPPSGTHYVQGGVPVKSLGVHEHWDSDATRRYSRNLDPQNGTGIELIYVPIEAKSGR